MLNPASKSFSLWAETPKLKVGSVTQPNIIPIFEDGKDLYQLAADWSVEYVGIKINIPCGFIFDGASVPRLLWCFFPPDGLYRPGVVVHDWLYINKGFLRINDFLFRHLVFSREDSDNIFRGVMLNAGVKEWKAQVMWAGVRLFGWIPWKKPMKPAVIKPLAYQMS